MQRRLPAVVLASEQFAGLAERIIGSNSISASPLVVIAGNPEYVNEAALMKLADTALMQTIDKLTKSA
jgi:hypothetical protein